MNDLINSDKAEENTIKMVTRGSSQTDDRSGTICGALFYHCDSPVNCAYSHEAEL